MKQTIDLTSGIPKICIPVMGKDRDAVLASCRLAAGAEHDLIEWRADYLGDTGVIEDIFRAIREEMPETPILVTFRTKDEGGERVADDDEYFRILRRLADAGADLLDVEYFHSPIRRRAFIEKALREGLTVIVSSHDFEKTPESGEMEALLDAMYETGAIPKLAVMPRSPADVLRLMTVTEAVRRTHGRPLITMAMGGTGVISRIAGELTGSALTFGAAGKTSAPGQLDADALADILRILHDAK